MKLSTYAKHNQRIIVKAITDVEPTMVHPQTVRAAARKYLKTVPCPNYVDSITGEERPGKWSEVYQLGRRVRFGVEALTQARYEFDAIVVPA